MSTEQIHWFRRPGTESPRDPGTFNPVFELLDHPIALGAGEETFFTAAEVSLSCADTLDRAAKFAGILRAVHDPAPPLLVIDDGLAPVTLLLAVLAGLRIGSCVSLGSKGLKPGEKERAPVLRPAPAAESAAADGAGQAGAAAGAGGAGQAGAVGGPTGVRAGMHTGTRRILSGFEGAQLLADGPGSRPLDAAGLMKEAAFKHAAPVGLKPGREVLRLDGVSITAAESTAAIRTLLQP